MKNDRRKKKQKVTRNPRVAWRGRGRPLITGEQIVDWTGGGSCPCCSGRVGERHGAPYGNGASEAI